MRIPHGLRAALAGQTGAATDPNFSDVSLLMYGDGANGSTTFVDSSSNNFTITPVGNAQISTTQSKFGGASMYFDGSGDYLSVADNDDFELGSGNFTLEAWVYLTGYSANYSGNYVAQILAKDSGSTGRSFTFAIGGTASSWTTVSVTLFASTSPLVYTGNIGSFNFSLNTWYHVAAVRSGTSVRFYVNGNDVGGGTNSTNAASTTTSLIIGAEDPFYQAQGFAYYFPGYIDDLRITKGVARYTANFTPPTALSAFTPGEPYFYNTSLLLHGDGTNGSTTFVDSSPSPKTVTAFGNAQISTAQSKFGGASMYFDGSGDYLSVPSDQDLNFGSGSLTIEFWLNFSSVPTSFILLVVGTTANTQLFITTKSNGQGLRFGLTGVAQYATATQAWATGTWYHVALTRNGSSVKFYVNGIDVSDGVFSNTTNYSGALLLAGGYDATGTSYFNGYIDDLRITKGVARYTANFTPPTASFSTLTPGEPYFYNTSLLLHGDGTNGSTTFVDSSSNNLTITPSGNAQISTTQSKFGGASMYFDGANDYLTVTSSTALQFGTSDFTVEMFVRRIGNTFAGAAASANVIDFRTAEPSAQFYLYITPSGFSPGIDFRYYVNGSDRLVSTTQATANTWRHVAIVRSSGVTRLYVDGTAEGGTWADATNYTASSCVIGGRFAAISGDFRSLNGYIDDLRITKGVARYTANFTPPTEPFPDL